MKKIFTILNRALITALLVAAWMPSSSCGADGMQTSKGMNCSNAPCCQSHKGCHHQTQTDCRNVLKAQFQAVVYAKSLKAQVVSQTVNVSNHVFSAVHQGGQSLQHFVVVQSPPGSSLVLRI